MKFLSNYLKYNTIILTILIVISNIITFENIPLWAYNENKTPLHEDLSNSEIISISSDNSTDKVLYLISENDYSFLYIKGKKYPNTYAKEITYLTSPLIEINDEYYFCSSSKNIFKLDSEGYLKKISNPNNLNNYNNYELKCFYMRKEKVLFVTFINTPFAYSYNLEESKWIEHEYGDSYLKLGDKILDSNLYNDDNIYIVRLGILYQEGTNYKFILFQYTNYQFGGILYMAFDAEMYSKTIFSFGKQDNQVFAFTYDPEQLSKYSFYLLDIGRAECMKSNGNLYLQLFKGTEIYDAYYIENSPALFYNIRKRELNGQYSFYIGAVDIEKLVILYNIKMDSFKKIFYNYSFLYQNKAFLKYFEVGNQIEICPFIYDSSNKLCQFYINEKNYYIFDKSNGDIENKMNQNCDKKIIGNYCVEECPIGFETILVNICNQCAENFYYHYATKNCIYTNEENYPTKYFIIYDCAKINLKYFDESCYKSCSDIYGIDTPNKENECTSCKSQNQIFFELKCYENCDVLYGIINPDNENECILCKNENKIYFESNCYNNCSEIYGIINPNDENECISCKNKNQIYFEYNCYDSCSDIYGMINPNDENECISCKNENKIYFESNCYNNCTEIYGMINPNDENECISCRNENKIYFDLNCYDSCSDIYGIINPDDENECIICKSENKIYLDNECINECPDGYELINTEINNYQVSYCQNCKEINKFFYDKKCHEKCPSKYQLYNDSDNICYYCHNKSDYEIFYQNGTCVSNCSEGYETIFTEQEKYCKFCKDKGQFLSHENKCEDNCETNSLYWEENNVCYFCNETENKFRQDDTCVKKCDRGYEINIQDSICRNCHKENKFFFEGHCQDNCPDNLAWNESNNICFDCYEEFQKNYLKNNHSCLSQCGKMKMQGHECIPCDEEKKYFFNYKCYDPCPNYTLPTDNGLESFCLTCQYFYWDGNCVPNCPTLYMKNEVEVDGITVNICTRCGIDNKSWYNEGNCVENCPDTTYPSEDHYCRFCFCGFSRHICDNSTSSDKCICDEKEGEGVKFGDNCEYRRIKSNKDLKIININPTISSKKSLFKYELTGNIKKKYPKANYTYEKKWKVFINNEEKTEMKNFAVGVNEEIFIINPNLLKIGKENTLTLDLNIRDLKNNSILNLHDEIDIAIQSLLRPSNPRLVTPDKVNKVMSNIFRIEIENNINPENYKLYYKLLIKDEHNEIIPIKQKEDLDTLLSRTNEIHNPLKFYLPISDIFIFELSNNREEVISIKENIIETDNRDIKYNLSEIIQGLYSFEDYSDIEKIFLVMKYMDLNKGEIFTTRNYDLLIYFMNFHLIKVANDKGSYENKNIIEKEDRYYMNYIEAKTIFSLMNKIFLHQKLNIPEIYFTPFLKIFKQFWDYLSANKNNAKYYERMPNSDILSFFRTFDHFLDIYKNKEINDTSNMLDEQIIVQILELLSKYLIIDTYPGETIRLVGKRILVILSHLSNQQNNLAFLSINNISETLKYDDYNTFSFEDYYLNKENCDDDGNTLFCIKPNDFNYFKQNKLNKIDIESFSLAIIKINKNGKNLENENEGDTLKLNFLYNKDHIVYYTPINGTFYDIELSLKDIIIPNNRKEFYIQTNEKDYSNITCIPKNIAFSKDYYCLTYFNYEKDVIKCSCNVFEQITYVSNSSLAKFYKDLQSKSAIKKYNFLNKISLILIFIIILLIFVPGCIYLLYDIRNDIKRLDINIMTFSEKIKQKYLQVKILNRSSIFSFGFYTTFFQFPFLSPLRICNYRSPKYIKHFIIILSIFYGFIVSLSFFYIFVPSKERKVLIDKRDINNPNFEINDIDSFIKYIKRGLIFSIIGVILTRIIIYIFGIILNYNKDELIYWREMKTIFTNYITNEIKGNVLLGPTWNKIKTRMIAYINICGDYILRKIKKKNDKSNKNFENYLSKIEKASERTSGTCELFPSFDIEEGIKLDTSDSKSNKSGNYRPPSIGSIKSNNSSKNKSKRYNLNVETINNSDIKSSKNTDSLNSKKANLKVVNTDKFQLYSTKIKKNKAITKNNKFERIKNKYICTRKNKVLYEIEIDSMSENMNSSHEYYAQLDIENEINFSYFPIQEFITNETLNYHSENTWVTTKLNLKFKPEGYWHLIIINALLFFLLFILIIIIFSLDKLFLDYFGIFIIKAWLISCVTIYFVIYPFLYYIKNLIGSFLLFNCYHLKNRAIFYKILFGLFVNKTMIYIFKVRNYITKYKNELDY